MNEFEYMKSDLVPCTKNKSHKLHTSNKMSDGVPEPCDTKRWHEHCGTVHLHLIVPRYSACLLTTMFIDTALEPIVQAKAFDNIDHIIS